MHADTPRSYHETEHQELFYPNADLHRPIAVHIPSALGPLGYIVYLRLAEADADRLGGVLTRLKVGGLRPDDVTLQAGADLTGPDRYPSKVAGATWVALCRAKVSRGDGELRFTGVPADLRKAHVLLCTWPRFVASGWADDWLAGQSDPQWASGGIPLGGIGCGKVEICRDGRFRDFSGNNNQDMPFEEPDGLDGAFLSVAVDGTERVLATRPVPGLRPVPALHADLAFPQAVLSAPELLPGLDIAVTLSGPIVPHDLKLSCLPGCVIRWRLSNHTGRPLTVACRMAWPNLVGRGGGIDTPETQTGYADGFYRYWEEPGTPTAERVDSRAWSALRYANAPSPVCPSADGHHYLAVRGRRGEVGIQLHPTRGSVARHVPVPPDGVATVDMVLCWEMPHWIDTLGVDRGHFWQTLCPDGRALLTLFFRRFDDILEEGGALTRLLADTDLPEFLKRRLANCCYPLTTNSVFYRDGRFSVNEGPTEMAGCYGTLDQRLAAHPATQLFFPALNRRELEAFAAIQAPNGGVCHDLGAGHLERPAGDQGWPDLTCSFVIQLAREAGAGGDRRYERGAWARARRAMLRHAEWAEQGGGVAQVGHGLGTSYDGYHYDGTTPYLATLWIATLEIARVWAAARRDKDVRQRVRGWIEAARSRMEADLWNGRFYRAYGSPAGPVNPNCHAGMLAGQVFARLVAGADVLPPDRLASCVRALRDLTASGQFRVPPDEVTPDGRPGTEFGWLPYVEAYGVTALFLQGDRSAMACWERILTAMDGDGRHPCDTRLMYRPTTGEPSWGAYYMTAPASWLAYEALLDFVYRPAERLLRLAPAIEGRFAVVHPCFWGTGSRTTGAGCTRVSLTVRRVFGRRQCKVATLEVPHAAGRVRCGGAEAARTVTNGPYDRVAHPLTVLRPGTTLTWDWVGETPPCGASRGI